MVPKSTKSKGAVKDAGVSEQPERELVARRAQSAYFPSTVGVPELREMFKDLWGVKTGGEKTGHPATHVVPASAGPSPHRYPFFVDYFYCGLCPPSLIFSRTSCTPMACACWILL